MDNTITNDYWHDFSVPPQAAVTNSDGATFWVDEVADVKKLGIADRHAIYG